MSKRAKPSGARAEMITRVALITGPTSGLGRGIALELAARRYQLVLLGRSPDKLSRLAQECVAKGAPAPRLLVCDMASLAQVRRAAAEFLDTGLPLHVLVNNAGQINQTRRITEDGLEETMAISYWSAFLLTLLLLPRMKDSAPGTIINTTSDTYPFGQIPFDDLKFEKRYAPLRSYAAAKLAVVYFTQRLSELMKPHRVSVNAYNPGMIYTGIGLGGRQGKLAKIGEGVWRMISKPVAEGIRIPLQLATASALDATTGEVYMRGKSSAIKPVARDPLTGAALWELSETVTGQTLPDFLKPPAARSMNAPLRFGVLGAARIAPYVLFNQVPKVAGVEVHALAEEYQSFSRLLNYARKYQVPKVYRSFEKLLADPDIDAVYIPLPISMHAQWTLRAIAAGKHVLCEKPMAANAQQAQQVHEAAQGSGLVVAEAMHSRYHPLAARVREIIASGEIGDVTRVDGCFSAYWPFRDFRFNFALGGGCAIDMGCYPVSFIRAVLGTEPTVLAAKAKLAAADIDGWVDAQLAFPGNIQCTVFMGMRALHKPLSNWMRFIGTKGSIDIQNFVKPEVYLRMTVRGTKGKRAEQVPGGSTYQTQLAAFVDAVRNGRPILTDTENAMKNQAVIDAIYRKAGMRVRGEAPMPVEPPSLRIPAGVS